MQYIISRISDFSLRWCIYRLQLHSFKDALLPIFFWFFKKKRIQKQDNHCCRIFALPFRDPMIYSHVLCFNEDSARPLTYATTKLRTSLIIKTKLIVYYFMLLVSSYYIIMRSRSATTKYKQNYKNVLCWIKSCIRIVIWPPGWISRYVNNNIATILYQTAARKPAYLQSSSLMIL